MADLKQSDPVDVAVRRSARVAYELARVRWALVRALPVAVVAGALSYALGGHVAPWQTALVVGTLVTACGCKSNLCYVGALAGCALGMLPVVAMYAAGAMTETLCCSVCGGGGLFAGVAVAWFARKSPFVVDVILGALVAAVLHALVGCPKVGALEIVGLAGGLLAGAAPILALTRRTAPA